jgi:hypothetical protein
MEATMRSERSKAQSRKSQKQVPKSPPSEKFKERDGKIDFKGTLGELRALAKKTPYKTNRFIMRAAIDACHAEGLTAKALVKVAFGMIPHQKLADLIPRS